jgi:type I restriction enzyme S subunit
MTLTWSGAPYLPQLPFGRLFRRLERSVPGEAAIVTAYTDGQVTLRSNRAKERYHEAADLSSFQGVEVGDFVVHGLDILRGSVGISDSAGAMSPVVSVCEPVGAVDVRYVAHVIRVQAATGYTKAMARGIREGGADFRRWGTLAELPIPVPPLEYQRRVCDYLDHETACIDTLIKEQQRLIEMLRERREAEADALLGSPIGARHTTVKRVLRPLSRPAGPGFGVVTAFRDGVVTLRSNRREDGYTFSNTEHGYQEIRPGDLVFHALDGFAGAVGISDSHGNATPVYHVCEARTGDHLPYVARLLRYLGRSGFLATQAPNVRERSVDFRNWSMFGRLPLTLPPVEEQRRIAEHLDQQNAKTDALIAETERFIELARERRAALITAAVTGQIDVQETA